MKICISNKQKNIVGAIVLIIGLWYLLSLFNPPTIVPPLSTIFRSLIGILTDIDMLKNIWITFKRLMLAMTISIIGGILLGIIIIIIPKIKNLIREMLNIFQVVPPVSVLVIMIMWFGMNGLPAIFIVVFSLVPLIAVNVIDAIDEVDKNLLDMAKVFKLSKLDIIYHIYFPSIREQLFTAITIGLTMGAKILVMGEVLTTSTGIGGRITTARLNLEPEMVIAWTVITICMYYILENSLNYLKKYLTYE